MRTAPGARPSESRSPESLTAVADRWLGRFEHALASRDAGELNSLFHADSHWRDVLALTWRISTTSGSDAIAAALSGRSAAGFRVDPARTAPREATRAGEKCVEAIFRFETGAGICAGVLRLKGEKAWTLLTALEDLKGHEERTGKRRPTGQSHSRDFRGPNWRDQREAAANYDNHDPVVLVVAPLSGHHSTLLRDTVRTLLQEHKVYLTDWVDARMVPAGAVALHAAHHAGAGDPLLLAQADDGRVQRPAVPLVRAVDVDGHEPGIHLDPHGHSFTARGGPR